MVTAKRIPVIATLLAGLFGCVSAYGNPVGLTYLVHVRTSFGTVFKDCFAFGLDGSLASADLGTLTLSSGNGFGPGKNSFFEAIVPASLAQDLGDTFSFVGYGFTYGKKGGDGYLKGVGLSGSNNRYVINGKPDSTCSISQTIIESRPYFPPQ